MFRCQDLLRRMAGNGGKALLLLMVLFVTLLPHGARSNEVFYWKLESRNGSEDGSAAVYARGQVVIRLRATLGGYTAGERADLVVDRLYDYFSGIGYVHEIRPGLRNGQAAVMGRGMVLVTVSSASARANGTTPERLAWVWSNNLRRALGAAPLGPEAVPSRSSPAAADARIASVQGAVPQPVALNRPPVLVTTGIASWYGREFQNRPTANGERFDMNALTAAHPEWPFGTVVRVRRPDRNRSVTVRINDRGPFVHGRSIDLSRRAAEEVGLLQEGVGPVVMEVLAWGR